MAPLKTGPWKLTDLESVPKNGLKVFSCFHCGGGSTMGYKLAGYEVLGGVEIDPEMMKVYKANHNPKYSFLMGVQDFNKIPRDQIPKELFELDILDGSPPCSSFSMAGSREKAWGEKKKFREGQTNQVLDDLFFHFIETARMLQPKVVIAENVKGLVIGKAKGYVKQIAQAFSDAGYDVQLFLLNAAFMGVPQKRERTFFVAKRKGLNLSHLKMSFSEVPVPLKLAFSGVTAKGKNRTDSKNYHLWKRAKPGENMSKYHPKGSLFNWIKLSPDIPGPTLAANTHLFFHWEEMRQLSEIEFKRYQSFPDDFKFESDRQAGYVCGMSVPPFMMQRVAHEIEKQWFSHG